MPQRETQLRASGSWTVLLLSLVASTLCPGCPGSSMIPWHCLGLNSVFCLFLAEKSLQFSLSWHGPKWGPGTNPILIIGTFEPLHSCPCSAHKQRTPSARHPYPSSFSLVHLAESTVLPLLPSVSVKCEGGFPREQPRGCWQMCFRARDWVRWRWLCAWH